MKYFNTLLIIIILIAYSQFTVAQDQSDTAAADQNHDETLLLIQRADSVRQADSIQREMLKLQLSELAETEKSKRIQLEQRLNDMNRQDSLKRAATVQEIDSLKKTAAGYPVVPYEDTLFLIHTKVANITARERAVIVNKRLKELYSSYIIGSDSISIIDYGQTVDIVSGANTLISISEYDAIWQERKKIDIAREYLRLIQKDIEYYKDNTSFLLILQQIGLALLVISLQVVLIRLVNLLFKRKIDRFLTTQKDKYFKGINIKNIQLMDSEKQTSVALFISKLLRWFVNLLQLYITVPILFSIFPPTRRLAETLFGYVLDPVSKFAMAVINYLPNLFAIVVIIFITHYVIKLLKYLTREIENGNLKLAGFYPDWAKPTYNIVRFLVLAFMFVVIFPYLPGSDSDIFRGVSVFIGVVFSLGSSSAISNMVAGLVLTYMRPFKIGDRIKIGDVFGDVVEKTPIVTRVRTPKNEFVTIPNSNILSSNVINYNTSREHEGVILHTTVTIGYDIPWKKVHELLIEAAQKAEHVLDNPPPFVLQTSLDDFYVSYQLNAYTNEPNKQASIYSELHQNIQDCFNENDVEILSPHYRAQRDGNTTTIPPDYLPADYKAPHFRVGNIENEGEG